MTLLLAALLGACGAALSLRVTRERAHRVTTSRGFALAAPLSLLVAIAPVALVIPLGREAVWAAAASLLVMRFVLLRRAVRASDEEAR